MKRYGFPEVSIRLRKSLAKAIQTWMDDNCEYPDWDRLNTYIADNTATLMAEAAIPVIAGQAALSQYLRDKNGCEHA